MKAALILAALAVLTGCSTRVHVSQLDPQLASGAEVNGIPFRVKERYSIALYRLEGGVYKRVDATPTVATLANQDNLYLLKLTGSPLSDSTVKVTVNGDNTLSVVNVSSTSKGQDALTELGSGLKSVAEARAARDKAVTDAEKAVETGVVATEDAKLAAMDAEKEAILAKLEFDALPADSTAIQRTTAELKVLRARVLANQKARRAGLSLPFPDAGT